MSKDQDIIGRVENLKRLYSLATKGYWVEATRKDGVHSAILERETNGLKEDYEIATFNAYNDKMFVCAMQDAFPALAVALLERDEKLRIAVEALKIIAEDSENVLDVSPTLPEIANNCLSHILPPKNS